MPFDTFDQEASVIERVDKFLNSGAENNGQDELRVLLDDYKALTKTSRRLVRIADRSEEALRQAKMEAEQAHREAEAAKDQTREFLAMISHELRTPISILKSEVELLSVGVRKPTVENFASLTDEIDHFNHLIDDMFQLSLHDINALKYEKDQHNIIEMLERSCEQFSSRFNDKGIELSLAISEQELLLDVDAVRIKQVFDNIIKNSCLYTDPGGQLIVSTKRAGESISIEFSDSKPGLTDQALENIFERFYRGENSRSRATGGAGLGMAICHEVVSEHGGRIEVDHSALGGIAVTVIL